MRGMKYARVSGILAGAALASVITAPSAFASAKDMDAIKARIRSQLDGNGGQPRTKDLDRVDVRGSPIRGFSSSYLNSLRIPLDMNTRAKIGTVSTTHCHTTRAEITTAFRPAIQSLSTRSPR